MPKGMAEQGLHNEVKRWDCDSAGLASPWVPCELSKGAEGLGQRLELGWWGNAVANRLLGVEGGIGGGGVVQHEDSKELNHRPEVWEARGSAGSKGGGLLP